MCITDLKCMRTLRTRETKWVASLTFLIKINKYSLLFYLYSTSYASISVLHSERHSVIRYSRHFLCCFHPKFVLNRGSIPTLFRMKSVYGPYKFTETTCQNKIKQKSAPFQTLQEFNHEFFYW